MFALRARLRWHFWLQPTANSLIFGGEFSGRLLRNLTVLSPSERPTSEQKDCLTPAHLDNVYPSCSMWIFLVPFSCTHWRWSGSSSYRGVKQARVNGNSPCCSTCKHPTLSAVNWGGWERIVYSSCHGVNVCRAASPEASTSSCSSGERNSCDSWALMACHFT